MRLQTSLTPCCVQLYCPPSSACNAYMGAITGNYNCLWWHPCGKCLIWIKFFCPICAVISDWCLVFVMCSIPPFNLKCCYLHVDNTNVLGNKNSFPTLFKVFACAEHFAMGKSRHCDSKFRASVTITVSVSATVLPFTEFWAHTSK